VKHLLTLHLSNQNIKVGTQFAIGTGNDSTCTTRTPPKLCFPSHTAPLGVKFNSNSTAAYISFHGSWYALEKLLVLLYKDTNSNKEQISS
jgi:glucose/arabinose dehydrogenase